MLRLPGPAAPLAASERYALELLADLSRLVPVDDTTADVVALEVTEAPSETGPISVAVGHNWHLAARDGTVTIPRAVLRLLAGVAAASAEGATTERDRHGRVPSSANALVAASLEREPVVTRAAIALRAAVLRAAGSRPVYLAAPWPAGHRWAVAMTHDLDVVSPWPVFSGLRVIELARKREWTLAARALAGAAAATASDPVTEGVEELLRAESESGVTSTWFVICATASLASFFAGDVTYRAESPRAARIIQAVARRGHTIGLHGSFATMDRVGAFAHQRRHLAALSAGTVEGVRQHFLRFRPGTTHRSMYAAGFGYDSSYGFPDRNGFRLGVADIVPLWDDEAGRALGLDEAPVVWMDRALSKYRAVESPDAWIDDALTLAGVCRDVEGLWVGIWHPNLVPALGFPGAPAAYRRLVRELGTHDPCFATLDHLVMWRRARRTTRVRALAPDGRVAVTAVDGTPVPLETSDTRPVRDVAAVSE